MDTRASDATIGGRARRIGAALLGSAWAAFLLPPQSVAWSGVDAPGWIRTLSFWPVYDQIKVVMLRFGTTDVYMVFGTAASLSFLLIGLALYAPLRRTRRILATLLAWAVLAGAPITFLSYLNHDTTAPLRFMWGWEGLLLTAIGVLATILAFALGGRSGWPLWLRIMLGSTPVLIVLSVFVLSYWPHGPLVVLGIEAALIAAYAPDQRTPAPRIHLPQNAHSRAAN
ncbi:MAG: hypothetical protein JWP70_1684 [Leifsonia sp.]|jgi:hypothetical protein|nr:hypothetical protein [Leifsonia sp.]MDQ1587640.1 hypothetical protein [Microbacteriaceae bacterium]